MNLAVTSLRTRALAPVVVHGDAPWLHPHGRAGGSAVGGARGLCPLDLVTRPSLEPTFGQGAVTR
jgi:hypothetical protein